MLRAFSILAASILLMGMSCEPPLVCGTPLDGSDFGFSIEIPEGLTCAGSLPSPNEVFRGFVVYGVSGSEAQVIVVIADGSSSNTVDVGGADQADCNDLGDHTNPAGITFERCKFMSEMGVSYSGFAALPGGTDRLLISVVNGTDDESFGPLLESVLDGVTLTQ